MIYTRKLLEEITDNHIDMYVDARLQKRILAEHAEIAEALGGMLSWALHTVADSDPNNDILPRGYDKWKALLDRIKEEK